MTDDTRPTTDRKYIEIPDAWVPGLVRAEGKVARGWQRAARRSWGQADEGAFGTEAHRRAIAHHLAHGGSVALVPPMGVVVADADNEAAARWLRSVSPAGTPIMRRHDASAHFYYRYDPDALDLKRSKGYEWDTPYGVAKLDFKASIGGYVIAPPSMHEDGRPYTWETGLPETPEGLPTLPDELEEMAVEKGLRVGVVQSAARVEFGELPGFDRIRSYVGRMCRYSSSRDEVEREARAYAEEVYASRPERLAEHMERDHARLVEGMWSQWGGAHPLDEKNDDQAVVDLWDASGRGDDWVYVDELRALMRCEQGVWHERGPMFLGRDVMRFRDEVLWHDANRSHGARRERLTALYMALRNNARIDRVVSMLRKARVVSLAEFDADPWLVAFPAGEGEAAGVLYDARQGGVRAMYPGDRITSAMGVPWTATVTDSDRELWARFLAETFPDPDLRGFVQEGVGLTLLGRALELHKFFFLYGRGRTGKSTFLQTLSAAFGSLARHADFSTFTESRAARGADHSADVAFTRGARLVVCTEIPDGARIGARMKTLTGDSHVTTREVYGAPFTMRVDWTAWVAGNDRPGADCMDSGIERRLQVIPANNQVSVDRVDATLGERLRAPGVLRAVVGWALEGLARVQERGALVECDAVSAASRDYWAAMNPIEAWLEERAERAEGASWPAQEAYRDYTDWLTESLGDGARDEIRRTSPTKFGRWMHSAGHPKEKRRVKGKPVWLFDGVRAAEDDHGSKKSDSGSNLARLDLVRRP